MNEEAALVRHVIVEGFVQGVGYREFARRSALRLNLSGWVRNRSDGTVEALARGGAADVEAFLIELRKGPRAAQVTRLRVVERGEDAAKATGEFVVRPTT